MKKFSDLTHNLTEASHIFNEDKIVSINESLIPLLDQTRSKILSKSLKNPTISLFELEEALDFVLDSSIDFKLEMTLDALNEEAFKKDDIEDAINTLPLDVEELKDFKITIDGKNILVNWNAKEGKVAIQIDGKDIKTEGRAYDVESLISSVRASLEDWTDEATSDDLDTAIEKEDDGDKRKKLATLKTIIVPRIISKFANSTSDRNRLIRSLTAYITKGDDEEVITTDVDQRAILDIFFDMLDVITSNKQLASLLSRNAVLVANSYITEAKKKKVEKKPVVDADEGVSAKLDILLKLGLVDSKFYNRAKKALGNKKAAGSVPQLRNILFDLLDKLIVYIKKDPTIYNRLRINVMKEMKGTLPTKVEVLAAKNAGIEAAKSGTTERTVPEQYRKHYFTRQAWLEGFDSKPSADSVKMPVTDTAKKSEPEKLDERLGMANYYPFWGVILGDKVTIGNYMMENKKRFKGRIITPEFKVSSMSKPAIAPGSIMIPNEQDASDRFSFYHSSLFDGLLAHDQNDIDDINSTDSYDKLYRSGSFRFYTSGGMLQIISEDNNVNTNTLLTGLKTILDVYSKAPAAILKVFPSLLNQMPDEIYISARNISITIPFDKHSLTKVRNKLTESALTNEAITYSKTADKVIANLTAHDSAAFTRLANQIKKLQVLEDDIKKIREDVKKATKEDIQSLFAADEAVMTRVVETVSFSLVLSKDPKPSETVKYKEVLEELSQNLTPELIAKLEELKKKYVTVTQKSPSLTLKESFFDTLKSFFKSIVSWGTKFDSKLAKLKKKLGGVIKEENMKTYKEFINESVDLSDMDALIDANEKLTELSAQIFETKEKALETVLGIIAPLGLSFDVAGSVDLESIELTSDAEEGQEAVVEVTDDMEEKIEGELSLNVSLQEVEGGFTITPELMVAFDEDEQMKLSDVDFEASSDDEEEGEAEPEMYTEAYIEGKTFNLILFHPLTRRMFSVIISANNLKAVEKQVKKEYPEYEINQVFPVTINDYTKTI